MAATTMLQNHDVIIYGCYETNGTKRTQSQAFNFFFFGRVCGGVRLQIFGNIKFLRNILENKERCSRKSSRRECDLREH